MKNKSYRINMFNNIIIIKNEGTNIKIRGVLKSCENHCHKYL